jgi:hypothetical protein
MIHFANLRACLAVAVLLIAVHSGRSPALGAQSVHQMPIGTIVKNVVQLGERQIPLPEGEWSLIAKETRLSGGSAAGVPLAYVYLAQVRGGVVARFIFAGTNLEGISGGWARDRAVCDRGDTHSASSDRNYNSRDTECWVTNHLDMTLGANTWQVHKDFFQWSQDKKRPATALAIEYYLVKNFDFLRVQYGFNPELEGFERTPNSGWRGNPWHKDHASEDPKKIAYIQKVKAEGERLLPLVRSGFDGRLSPTEPNVPAPSVSVATPATSNSTGSTPDAVERLKQLQSLLNQKLITPEEYAARRQKILDDL